MQRILQKARFVAARSAAGPRHPVQLHAAVNAALVAAAFLFIAALTFGLVP